MKYVSKGPMAHVYDLLDYQALHQHVLDYKDGNEESATKIVDSFNGFLLKYVNLITNGGYNPIDFSIRNFIALYITQDYVKKYASSYDYKPKVKEKIEDTVIRITSLFQQYSTEEIKNELICILLSMARKYKDYEKPSFHNYVDKCFHFEAFRGLSHLTNDPIARLSYDEFIDNTSIDPSIDKEFERSLEEMCQDINIKNSDIPVIIEKTSTFSMNSLNVNWINGVTCGDNFKDLSPFERKILTMHYVEGLTDTEIAEQIGVCRATINRRRLHAKEKLSKVFGIKDDNPDIEEENTI